MLLAQIKEGGQLVVAMGAGKFRAGGAHGINGQALFIGDTGGKSLGRIFPQELVTIEFGVGGNGKCLPLVELLPAIRADEGAFFRRQILIGCILGLLRHVEARHINDVTEVKGRVVETMEGHEGMLLQILPLHRDILQLEGSAPLITARIMDVPNLGIELAEVRAIRRVSIPANQAGTRNDEQVLGIGLNQGIAADADTIERVLRNLIMGEEAASPFTLGE